MSRNSIEAKWSLIVPACGPPEGMNANSLPGSPMPKESQRADPLFLESLSIARICTVLAHLTVGLLTSSQVFRFDVGLAP
jgi:hypothetical protein